jgi:hypothetical protein
MMDSRLQLLGKLPPRRDKRTLKLQDYLPVMPPTPVSKYYSEKVKGSPTFLNTLIGDCVFAAAGNMIMSWTAYASSQVTLTDAQIQKAYSDVTGYIPGDPSTDNGTVMLDALNYWRQTGIGNHKIYAFVTVPLASLNTAIFLFGNVMVGLAMPLSAQGQPVWNVQTGSLAVPGSWGGHCVPYVGYNSKQRLCRSWGNRIENTDPFTATYCDEAYAVLTYDWIEKNGASPSSFNFSQLESDLKLVTA